MITSKPRMVHVRLLVVLSGFLWPFVVGITASAALEDLDEYETWANGKKAQKTMRSDRWRGDEDPGGTEVSRGLSSKRLVMRFRAEGEVVDSLTPTGFTVARNFLRLKKPTSVTAIATTVTVDKKFTVIPCDANNVAATTQAGPTHIALARFNDGASTGPTDRTGDIEGVISAIRNGSSTDPEGVLQVEGAVIRSTAASGNFNQTLDRKSLGTVKTGRPFTLTMQWDKPNKAFLFGLDDNPVVSIAYTQSDSAEAVLPFAQIFQRHQVANCHDGTTVIDSTTKIGTVLTNASAVIP